MGTASLLTVIIQPWMQKPRLFTRIILAVCRRRAAFFSLMGTLGIMAHPQTADYLRFISNITEQRACNLSKFTQHLMFQLGLQSSKDPTGMDKNVSYSHIWHLSWMARTAGLDQLIFLNTYIAFH